VAKDLREEIWNRFKEASTVVRKRHQEFFEARKAQEEAARREAERDMDRARKERNYT
jgi:hypothetical protein